MLSNWRWMTLCLMVFKNGCLASFMAQGSKTYMWFFISWADHILSVEIPLHVATQPFIEASVCINTSADGWINARPLRSFTFCTHHFKLIFEILFKIILSKKERFSYKDNICCWGNYNSTLQVKLLEWLTSTSQSTLLTPELMFVDCLTNSDILKLLSEFLFCLMKILEWQSLKTDFFQFMANPRCYRRKITVLRLLRISFKVTNQ